MSGVETVVIGRPMVERLARVLALHKLRTGGFHALDERGGVMQWQDQVELSWRLHVGEARELLGAMWQPTAAMIEAGDAVCAEGVAGRLPPPDLSPATHAWPAMVIAALDEVAP